MTQINQQYAKQKLAAVARAPQQSRQRVRENSYWRIASEAELFGAELSLDGSLTPQQYAVVEQRLQDAGVL